MDEPQAGDIIVIQDWNGDHLTLKVKELFDSKKEGRCVSGSELEGGVGHRFRSLPLAHIVHTARIEKVGRGKWDLHCPNGDVERLKSKQAAKDRGIELGYHVEEV